MLEATPGTSRINLAGGSEARKEGIIAMRRLYVRTSSIWEGKLYKQSPTDKEHYYSLGVSGLINTKPIVVGRHLDNYYK